MTTIIYIHDKHDPNNNKMFTITPQPSTFSNLPCLIFFGWSGFKMFQASWLSPFPPSTTRPFPPPYPTHPGPRGAPCPRSRRPAPWWPSSEDFCYSNVSSISLYIDMCVCVSIYLPIYLSICLSVCLSIYQSINLPIYLSIHLSIYLSICFSIAFS